MKSAVVTAAIVVLSAACAQQPVRVDFSERQREYVAKDYGEVYERWTRHQQALHNTDVALEAWATFKSWDFRQAYIERYASIYGLSETDRATLRQAQLEAVRAWAQVVQVQLVQVLEAQLRERRARARRARQRRRMVVSSPRRARRTKRALQT